MRYGNASRTIGAILVTAGLALGAPASRADETKIKPEALPKKVLKAAKELFPKGEIVGAAKETEDGETMFEVMMKVDGKSVDVVFEEDGDVEAIEKEIDVDDLPRAVAKAAAKAFPNGKIAKVEEITLEDDKVVYELAVKTGDKEEEVVMAPNGKVIDLEADDDDDDEKGKAKGKKDKDDDDDKKGGKKKEKDDDDDDDKKGGKKKEKDDDKKSDKKKEKDDK